MKVPPRIFFPLGGGGWLGLLREKLGDEDALVGSRVPFLAFGRRDLVLGFILPGELDPFLCAGAAVRRLPELAGSVNAMGAQLLAHPGVPDVDVEGLNHQLLLDAWYHVHLLSEALDELSESLTQKLLEVVELAGNS